MAASADKSIPGRRIVELPDAQATVNLGIALGTILPRGTQTWLCGELGAGKTTLTRGVLKALGHQDAVKSPTYTIVEPYESLAAGPLYHFDLYRLGDPEELEYLGLRDYLASGARLIFEWPERAGLRLPSPDMTIALEVHGATRVATISARGADLASELEGLRLSSLDSTIDP